MKSPWNTTKIATYGAVVGIALELIIRPEIAHRFAWAVSHGDAVVAFQAIATSSVVAFVSFAIVAAACGLRNRFVR